MKKKENKNSASENKFFIFSQKSDFHQIQHQQKRRRKMKKKKKFDA